LRVARRKSGARHSETVAATVRGVDANVLARQGAGSTPSCQAKNKSQALNDVVQRQLVAQK